MSQEWCDEDSKLYLPVKFITNKVHPTVDDVSRDKQVFKEILYLIYQTSF